MTDILLGLGGNIEGSWGCPRLTLDRVIAELFHRGIRFRRRAGLYLTRPVGRTDQPMFLNTVVVASTDHGPGAVMHICKQMERAAGRRRGPRNGPRPLDIDILAFGQCVRGWPVRPALRQIGRLILPHPEMHRRAFVLRPLNDVAPRWIHPVLGGPAGMLLHRLGEAAHGGIVGPIEGSRGVRFAAGLGSG